MNPLILTYYLPQFHEIEENNKWWGKGFTEWTNINEAKIFFSDHEIRKPTFPLGQYNLLEKSVISKQFEIANKYGIDGFMIWNYWFGDNNKILEKPLELIGKENVDVHYCLAWANHSWLNKTKGVLLKEQLYLGEKDYIDYFNYLKPYFLSKNYIKIDNKPVFSIFRPQDIPDLDVFLSVFERLAKEASLSGIYWLAENTNSNSAYVQNFENYYDSTSFLQNRKVDKVTFLLEKINSFTKGKINFGPFVYDYKKLAEIEAKKTYKDKKIPVIFTGWDTSVRHKKNGIVLRNFNTSAFEEHVESIVNYVKQNPVPIIIVKSWNEWAEGNILEPDEVFKTELLDVFYENIKEIK